MIKINKNKLDLLTSQVKDLETEKESLIEENEQIDAEIEREQEILNIEYKFVFDNFLKKKLERKKGNINKINILIQEIDRLDKQKLEIFSEKAKFEIILENKIKQQKQLNNIAESKQNDEYAIIQVNQKQRNQ